MSINREIKISKDEIFNRYTNLNNNLLEIIKALYGENSNINLECFYSDKIINLNGNNDLTILNNYSDKIGVYIFLDNDNIPVYIGVAGKNEQRLKQRLSKHFNCGSDSNLSSNIKYIENQVNDEGKVLILTYTPKLLLIEIENFRTASAIEQSLIALFNSKYNK